MHTEPAQAASKNSNSPRAALGGAVGGCVVLLALIALTIGVVAVLFKYLKPKSYFGVEENNGVIRNNTLFNGFERGESTERYIAISYFIFQYFVGLQ